MRRRLDISISILVTIMIVIPFFLSFLILSGQAANPSLLVNGYFEGGTYMMLDNWGNRIPEVEVPIGWDFGWDEIGVDGFLHRPEVKSETNTTLIGKATKMFTSYSTHRAWYFQRVQVVPGETYRFTFYARVWSSSQDDPSMNVGGSYWVNSCIDPWGENDPYDEGVECYYPMRGLNLHGEWNQWVKFQQEIVAESEWMTVFILGEAEWRLVHNDLYADEAALVQVTENPTPTFTRTATSAPTPTTPPTDAPTPTPTGSVVVTPTQDLARMISAVLTEVARQTGE